MVTKCRLPRRGIDFAATDGSTTARIFLGARVAAWGLVVVTVAGCSTAETVTDGESDAGTTPASAVADCSEASLERDLGELGLTTCEGDWAAVMPLDYAEQCTECESTWLARWSGSTWELTAQCYVYTILTETENGCAAVSGNFKSATPPTPIADAVAAVPPPDIACQIWGYNSLEENRAVTGCDLK